MTRLFGGKMLGLALIVLSIAGIGAETSDEATGAGSPVIVPEKADGFSGIWYMNQRQDDEYKFKYSGGFATYPQQHIPIAIYRPEVDKTFFTYGGVDRGTTSLLHMVSFYDHKTSELARPRRLLDKKTTDAHDNPVMAIDDEGHIFIFSPSHGGARPTYIHRSVKPYDIDAFTALPTFNYSYPQPKYIPGKGFLFLYTKYKGGRALYMNTSENGTEWGEEKLLSLFGEGHYQVSNHTNDGRVATAFNYHPKPGGLNKRTDIYYMETSDMGETWTSVDGSRLDLPLATTDTKALAHDYEKDDLLVYLKDIAFDAEGQPVILYLTSRGFESGPRNDPRTWYTTRWTGDNWKADRITTSGNNYDYGSLYIEPDGTWRVIAAAVPGPQPYNTGGEVGMWTSTDQGTSWNFEKQLTNNSKYNHTYARRPVNAKHDFYAIWADGHGRESSESNLYYTDKNGSAVWQMPVTIEAETVGASRQ